MNKNTALRGLASIGTLVIANATQFGAVVNGIMVELVADMSTGQTLNRLQVIAYAADYPDTLTIAWWLSFAVFTAMAMYLARRLIVISGRAGRRAPGVRRANVPVGARPAGRDSNGPLSVVR